MFGEGGPNPLMGFFGPGGPYPLVDLDRGYKSTGGSKSTVTPDHHSEDLQHPL